MTLLEVENLEFGYAARILIPSLSFTLARGELLHVQGPNGTGKSTLLALVAGLLQPRRGVVRAGKDVASTGPITTILEYLPAEANGLYGRLDAEDNLKLWLRLRGRTATSDALDTALGTWGLDHPLVRRGFPVERFSTGMKRRLALARVMLSPAPVWLLDEPFYGLDDSGIRTFQEVLRAQLDKGGAALMVSHEVRPLEPFAPRSLRLTPGGHR